LLVFDTFKAWNRLVQTHKKAFSKLTKTATRNLLTTAMENLKENYKLRILRDSQKKVITILARRAYKNLVEGSFHIWKRVSLIKRRISINIKFEKMTESMTQSRKYIERVQHNELLEVIFVISLF